MVNISLAIYYLKIIKPNPNPNTNPNPIPNPILFRTFGFIVLKIL